MKIFGFNISVSRGDTRDNVDKSSTNKNILKEQSDNTTGIEPGRVSEPDDVGSNSSIYTLKDFTRMVNPSFRVELIQLIRDLYKVNPDVYKAVKDMFQLTNTGHKIQFPNNTDEEVNRMSEHLEKVSNNWTNYTSGIDGLVNKMIVQYLVSGAMSIEAVPNDNLDGLATILFVKPDSIVFKREKNGVYQPYQKNPAAPMNNKDMYIKLNNKTYKYVSVFNDTDEPYGIPPFMASLDSLKTQSDMKINIKHIMENAGLLGFMEALMLKPDIRAGESLPTYKARLDHELRKMKRHLKDGMKDGLVVGYKDDHEFKLNSTTKDMSNLDKPWTLNQQSVANGLGVSGSLIGVSGSTYNSEGGAGINLSTLISQLKNLQNALSYLLKFIYSLELQLAGFNCKGINIVWLPATVSDDVKIQQARQYKVAICNSLYRDGIISQLQYAQEMGYDTPDLDEPRVSPEDQHGKGNSDIDITEEDKDKDSKNTTARRGRDKAKIQPKRQDQKTQKR